jgi:serpin B
MMGGGAAAFASELQSLDACGGVVRANNIYLKDTADRVRDDFKDAMIKLFAAIPQTLPFASDPERAANVINHWVSTKTNGRITQLVQKQSIDKDTSLIAVSALVFDGLWLANFKERDEKLSFHTLDKRCVAVDAMVCSAYLKTLYTPDFCVVEIPYQTTDVSFIVFVPIVSFEEARWLMTVEKLNKMINEMSVGSSKTELVLPMFKMEVGQSVVTALRSIGIVKLFDKTACDLSGISTEEDMVVSNITQKLVLKIDTKGTEAAAVTFCDVVAASGGVRHRKRFIVDKPFLFAVWSHSKNVPVFWGQFCEPCHP